MKNNETFLLEVTGHVDDLNPVRQQVSQWLNNQQYPPDKRDKVVLCLDETLSNLIRHGKATSPAENLREATAAGKKIKIEMELGRRLLQVCITDYQHPFKPRFTPSPNISALIEKKKKGSLGLSIIHKLATEVVYEKNQDSNTTKLFFDVV